MDYKKIYFDIIGRGVLRCCPDEYYERHHIIPKCFGGIDNDDNLVNLTFHEHYLAHLCLMKIYPEELCLCFAIERFYDRNRTRHLLLNRMPRWIRKRIHLAKVRMQRSW